MTRYIFGTGLKKKPLYYNIQISVDKDYTYTDNMPTGYAEIKFYKDSPIILTFESQDWWSSSEKITIRKPIESTNLYLFEMGFFAICNGSYPLPEVISVIHNEVTFTFTPIPVYE